jgi:hypothetical protein
MSMTDKLETFRAMVEADTRRGYAEAHERDKARGLNYPLSVHEPQMIFRVKMGGKYAKVDVGTSGRYMVELDTGNIYGIKAYGVIHRGHAYGNLDTIAEWDWSGYKASKRAQVAAKCDCGSDMATAANGETHCADTLAKFEFNNGKPYGAAA